MTKNDTHVYSCRRKAFAPFWISVIRKTIRSFPGGAALTVEKKYDANANAARALTKAR